MSISRRPGVVKTVTIDAAGAAYAAADNVGTPREITNAVLETGGVATLVSLGISETGILGSDLEFHFWNAQPTTLGGDNNAFAATAAEIHSKWLGMIGSGTTWVASSTLAETVTKLGQNLKVHAAAGYTSIWVSAVLRTAGETFTANGIVLKVGLDQN